MPILYIAIQPTRKNGDILEIDPCLVTEYETCVDRHNSEEGQENSGFDVLFAHDVILPHNHYGLPNLFDTGICAQMVNDVGTDSAYWLMPRSSICKVPIQQFNGVGLIDRGYRGRIKIPVIGTRPGYGAKIDRYSRYFQLAHPTLEPFKVEIVSMETLTKTARGANGFGSTGNGGTK